RLARRPDRQGASAILSWLAIALIGEGDVGGAIDAARRAISLDPDDRVARFALETARRTH
ncbi:MAG TPA: tetratricopeptide repeat protein, partial [Polyangiaceae bacterium]|nr:tetratricopeptide repeat protein [Polyangiaceae bacterium]